MAEEDFNEMDIDENRIVAMGEQTADDWQYNLRPRHLTEYIGQDKAKKNLSIFIQAAMKRGRRGREISHSETRFRRRGLGLPRGISRGF